MTMTTTILLSHLLTRISRQKKHVDYEIFKFREAKQQEKGTMDQSGQWIRKLAATCGFASIDKEVKLAIIQNCSSKRLRRYALLDNALTGMTKRRVIKRRVISESYDFGELCMNHAQTTPTFTNDHTQYLNSLDVFLNVHERVIVLFFSVSV